MSSFLKLLFVEPNIIQIKNRFIYPKSTSKVNYRALRPVNQSKELSIPRNENFSFIQKACQKQIIVRYNPLINLKYSRVVKPRDLSSSPQVSQYIKFLRFPVFYHIILLVKNRKSLQKNIINFIDLKKQQNSKNWHKKCNPCGMYNLSKTVSKFALNKQNMQQVNLSSSSLSMVGFKKYQLVNTCMILYKCIKNTS
eukprot:TRINITY_DN1345_c0_g1_i1.p1 TRINITY_DN1345_c0_g1~~TRINITY_DN1345_c0_g1_i1.p1  ORF type:complete len:218 (+),score=-8.71 TRINITY_DN1345_c0_g1_i1:69-656(+)